MDQDAKKYQKPEVEDLGVSEGELPEEQLKEVSGGVTLDYDCGTGFSVQHTCNNGNMPQVYG